MKMGRLIHLTFLRVFLLVESMVSSFESMQSENWSAYLLAVV